MSDLLDTNLNQYPYFSDYDPSKQYYNTLFKPSIAVQARELNVLQESLYHQIYRLGQNLFVSGTIISGCNITTKPNLSYIKILDNFANGAPISSTSTFPNNYLISNTGLKALITDSLDGLVSLSPNLNTLYITYLNTVTNTVSNTVIKVFQNDEVLKLTNASNVTIAQITVANTISSGSSNTSGYGYKISVDNGVVFQKGYMLEVSNQSLIISPYSITPTDMSVGFTSIESIVTAYQDQTLLDNAQGSPNQFGVGADRLKITPTLTTIQTTTANTLSNNFFSIINFVNGAPSIVNQNTVYSVIGDNMANRTYETNGDFIVKPFNIRALNFVSPANGSVIDPNYMRIEIDKGEAYIFGYRVAIDGQVLTAITKGIDYTQVNNGIISSTIGDYLQLQEVSGLFDPTINETILLLDAPCYSVSNGLNLGISPNVLTPSANVIGAAQLYAFSYNSGQPSTSSATCLAYLFNINMNTGKNFSSVKAIKGSSSGMIGYGDITLINGLPVIQNSNYPTKILDTKQAAIKTFKTAANTIDTQFYIRSKSSFTIPTTGNSTLTIPSYSGANSELPYGAGLLDIPTMDIDFTLVCETNVHSSNIAGSITISSSSNVVTGSGTSFNGVSFLQVGSYITVVNSTSSETKQVSSIVNSSSLTTSHAFSSGWSSANLYISYLPGQIIPVGDSNCSINIVNSSSMTLTLPTTINATMSAVLLYNTLLVNAAPAKKHYQTTAYVKINCGTHPANTIGPWCLGIPDITHISNVWVGTTYSNTNPSFTQYTSGDSGQRDSEYKQGWLYNRGMNLSNTSLILVELQCYIPDYSSGVGYFSIDSYPIDDTGVTANSIYTFDINYYIDTNQKVYNLRNCLDFRPVCVNTIPYVTDITSAISSSTIVNPVANSVTITNSGGAIPDSLIESSYQYYMSRYDKIGLKPDGTIAYSKGNPAENPIPPVDIPTGITLAMITIPPYPSLTPDIPFNNVYTPKVSIAYKANQRYTMAAIGTIDDRLKQVEYYTSLSVLEQSTQNLQLTNEAGQTRFKNGILVDPMNDFAIANTTDPEFNICIDAVSSVARPVFNQSLIDLKVTSLTRTVMNDNRLIMLQYAICNPPIISQPYASHLRNAAQDRLWVWNGKLTLNPPGDYYPDVTKNPAVNITLDQYSNWVNLPNAWGTQWGTWNEISSVNTINTQTGTTSNGSSSTTTATTTTTTSTTSQQIGTQITLSPETSTYSFGDVVTGVSIQPYVKPQLVQFEAYGLKPNTPMYLYINDTPVVHHKAFNLLTDAPMWSGSYNVVNTGWFYTDNLGNMYGQFKIPPTTFYTGTLNVQFLDIPDLTVYDDVITTQAITQFFAQNLSYTENKLNLTTIEPVLSYTNVSNTLVNNYISNISVNVTVNTYVTPNTINYTPNTINYTPNTGRYATPPDTDVHGGHSAPGPDPIAQSFEISDSLIPSGLEGVYVTSIDLFFQTTAGDTGVYGNDVPIVNNQIWDDNLGITVQIQPISNGTIQNIVVPFSSIHINPANVAISQNATVPCNVVFPAPVFLSVDELYAIVITTDASNPDYNIWTAVIGANDIITSSQIYNFTSDGDMFLSSQGITWNPYGNENFKFNVYCAIFVQNDGYVTINNQDYDYISLNSVVQGFNEGESVYFSNSMFFVNNAAHVVNNYQYVYVPDTTPLGNSSSFNGPNIYIGVISAGNQNSFVSPINSIINSTAFTLVNNVPFGDTNATIVTLNSLVGTVKYANLTNIVVYNPNANSSNYLTSSIPYILDSPSGAYGSGNLINIPYDTICPKFTQSVPSECSITYSMSGYSNTYVSDNQYTTLNYNTDTSFLDKERVILSRSNEIAYLNGGKSLTINAYFTTTSQFLSPAIDTAKMGVVTVYNLVNADDANNDIFYSEITNNGNAINKYISTTVTLGQGLDAEDMIVYVGAYYPPGASIYVYGKIQNEYDISLFTSKPWSPMYTNNTYRSSSINQNDIAEYIFTFPQSSVPTNTAYIDTTNNNVLSYQTSDGTIYATYNQFALKIVLLSNTSQIVPQITDYRLIALQS